MPGDTQRKINDLLQHASEYVVDGWSILSKAHPSKTDEMCFLLVQATQTEFDYVPVPFHTIEAALPFSLR
jgi:hypothetical protein